MRHLLALLLVVIGVVAFVAIPSCTPTVPGKPVPQAAEFLPVEVQLPVYTPDQVISSTDGSSPRISGHMILDFDDALTLDEIDTTLAGANLTRVGHVTGFNIITVKTSEMSDVTPLLIQAESLPGVSSAIPNYVLVTDNKVAAEIAPVAGELDPANGVFNRLGPTGITLSDKDLTLNWPHYVMDTFPAHALADEVIGSRTPSDVIVAVMDTGGFQNTKSTGSLDDGLSILTSEFDRDLAPIVVDPTGIIADLLTGIATITVGAKDRVSNALIGAFGNELEALHGLDVATCAVAQGQDIIGTGRHVRLRPIKLSINASDIGFCSLDPSESCKNNTDCPPDTGKCDFGVTTTDMFVAVLSKLGERLSDDTRVVNMSIGFKENNVDTRDKIIRILSPVFERFIQGNRIVVVSAGNDGTTEERAFSNLGSLRTVDRLATGASQIQRGLVVVGGTALPRVIGRVSLESPLPALDFSADTERHDSDVTTGRHIHVAAPSELVPVLARDLLKRRLTGGTSFSAPYVAGLAAEMFAVDPSATNAEVVSIIERTADDLDAVGPDDNVGHGRINCWKAILTLLNRKDIASAPTWLGVRFRNNLLSDDSLRVSISGVPIENLQLRRVADRVAVGGDNSRNLPSATALPAAIAFDFSIETSQLNSAGGVGLFEVASESGTITYQLPVRTRDLIETRPLDSSIDDHVFTLDIRTESASMYGQVTDATRPVSGAEVCYTSISGANECVSTDSFGYYVAYGVKPDESITISASTPTTIGDSLDVLIPAFRAIRQDFALNAIDVEFLGNAALAGTVIESLNELAGDNQPFPGVTVTLFSQDTDQILGTTITDAAGEYFLKLPQPGAYYLMAEASGYATTYRFIQTVFDRTDFANFSMHSTNESCSSSVDTFRLLRGYTRFGTTTFRNSIAERENASGFSMLDAATVCLDCAGARPQITWNTDWVEERFGFAGGLIDRIRVVHEETNDVLFDLNKKSTLNPSFSSPIRYGEVNQLVEPEGDMPDLVVGERYFIVFGSSLSDRAMTFEVLSTGSSSCADMGRMCPAETVRPNGDPLFNVAVDHDGATVFGASETRDVIINVNGLVAYPIDVTVSIDPTSCEGTPGCTDYSFTVTINDESELPFVVPSATECFYNGEEIFSQTYRLQATAVDACGAIAPPSKLLDRYLCCHNGGRFGCPE